MGHLPAAQESYFLSMHSLSLSVRLVHSLPYKQKVPRYAWHEHDMANIPLQATTRFPQDRVILELEGSRLNDGHLLYNISRSQAIRILTHTTSFIISTQ
jgi:hypothetical protein